MPTFYDWLRYQKKITESEYKKLSQSKRIEIKHEWCKYMGMK